MFFRRSELHSGLSHFSVPHSYWALTVWLSNSFILHFSTQKAMFAYAHQCKCPHQYGLSPSWCLQRHHRSCPHLCLSTEMLMQQDVILFSPAEVWAVTWPRGLMIGPSFFFFLTAARKSWIIFTVATLSGDDDIIIITPIVIIMTIIIIITIIITIVVIEAVIPASSSSFLFLFLYFLFLFPPLTPCFLHL